MSKQTKRLYFIDAMRAWAILMMLQGHFIDGLLDPVFRDPANTVYSVWKYFRGITAPVFFTVSGFIFTFLLLRAPNQGVSNPRIRKGVRRGLELLVIGYLLRTNLFGILQGRIYPGFYLVDVLHCIGLSLLLIIGLYLIAQRLRAGLFPILLITTGVLLFIFEPAYIVWDLSWMPSGIENYFSKANGSVFTIIPWAGYAAIGAFLSWIFLKFQNNKRIFLWSIAVSLISGWWLITQSSAFFSWIAQTADLKLFEQIVANNYLFIRLGDVMLVFAVFILLRKLMEQRLFLRIGQNTLSIYVIHFIILYGSFTGMGLYRFLHDDLSPAIAIPGALIFMIACTWIALIYDTHELSIKSTIGEFSKRVAKEIQAFLQVVAQRLKLVWSKLLQILRKA